MQYANTVTEAYLYLCSVHKANRAVGGAAAEGSYESSTSRRRHRGGGSTEEDDDRKREDERGMAKRPDLNELDECARIGRIGTA
jgi:hypothetical protein